MRGERGGYGDFDPAARCGVFVHVFDEGLLVDDGFEDVAGVDKVEIILGRRG